MAVSFVSFHGWEGMGDIDEWLEPAPFWSSGHFGSTTNPGRYQTLFQRAVETVEDLK